MRTCAANVLPEGGTRIALARRSTLFVGIALMSVGACAADDERAVAPTALGDDAITVGSFAFSESVLLAEIYSQALEAGGYRVERALGLGPREFVGPALSVGLIELLPEYAGTALTVRSLGRTRPSADVATTHDGLVRALAGTDVSALAAAPAQNSNTFVVTAPTAERYDLDALSDLAAVAGELSLGGPPECERRPLRLVGLKFADVVRLDPGGPVTHAALRTGGIDVALLLSRDPRLSAYVELDDDRRLQPAENVTLLLRREVVERWGVGIVEVIDAVSCELDTETLRGLTAADAEIPGSDDIAAIAAAWLRSKGLP